MRCQLATGTSFNAIDVPRDPYFILCPFFIYRNFKMPYNAALAPLGSRVGCCGRHLLAWLARCESASKALLAEPRGRGMHYLCPRPPTRSSKQLPFTVIATSQGRQTKEIDGNI